MSLTAPTHTSVAPPVPATSFAASPIPPHHTDENLCTDQIHQIEHPTGPSRRGERPVHYGVRAYGELQEIEAPCNDEKEPPTPSCSDSEDNLFLGSGDDEDDEDDENDEDEDGSADGSDDVSQGTNKNEKVKRPFAKEFLKKYITTEARAVSVGQYASTDSDGGTSEEGPQRRRKNKSMIVDDSGSDGTSSPSQENSDNESPVYDAEDIKATRVKLVNGKPAAEYLIAWENCDPKDTTWETSETDGGTIQAAWIEEKGPHPPLDDMVENISSAKLDHKPHGLAGVSKDLVMPIRTFRVKWRDQGSTWSRSEQDGGPIRNSTIEKFKPFPSVMDLLKTTPAKEMQSTCIGRGYTGFTKRT